MFVAILRLFSSYAKSFATLLAGVALFLVFSSIGNASADEWPMIALIGIAAAAVIALMFFTPILVRGGLIYRAGSTTVGDLVAEMPEGAAVLVLYADHRLSGSTAAMVEIEGIGEAAVVQWSGTVAAVPPGRYAGRAWISLGMAGATDFGFEIAPGETLYLLVREQLGVFGFSARVFPAGDEKSARRAGGARVMLWRTLAPGINGLSHEEPGRVGGSD